MDLKVTSDDTVPWEGTVEDLLEWQEIPELVQRRIEGLTVGETVKFGFRTKFTVERVA